MFALNPFREDRMTPLRQRLIDDLQLRGYADRTVEAYVRAVVQLARFYHAAPDRLTEEQVRHYLLHLATVQQVARGTHTIALCGLKFFSQQTLARPWSVLDVARPKGEKKLPVVLSREGLWRMLGAVRNPVYRVCRTTISACGLRLMEGARLQGPAGRTRLLQVLLLKRSRLFQISEQAFPWSATTLGQDAQRMAVSWLTWRVTEVPTPRLPDPRFDQGIPNENGGQRCGNKITLSRAELGVQPHGPGP